MSVESPSLLEEVAAASRPTAASRGALGARRPGIVARRVLVSARPRQWIKNGLVFLAPAAAAVLGRASALEATVEAFVVFCLLASATYLGNDVRDRRRDRLHPTKRTRPIAAGLLSPALALLAASGFVTTALTIAWLVRPVLFVVALAYLLLTLGYCLGLKAVPILECLLVAGGFLLRGLAGGAATGVAISAWFLTVVSLVALLVVVGKRYAEHRAQGATRDATRTVLARYSETALRRSIILASVAAAAAYALWAIGPRVQAEAVPWALLSSAPFALALARYWWLVRGGSGEAPEALLFEDRALQLLGIAWLASFLLAAPSIA